MRTGLLTEHADFRRLWLGATISNVGTQVSSLAVPLIAVLTLHASVFVVGALTALSYAPYLLIGLPAGAWIDRLRRRPIMIITDLLRAALLLGLPIAFAFDALTLPLLSAVALGVGACSVLFDLAERAFLPSLVGRDHLVEANTRLSASSSVSRAIGPALGGWLVGVLTAPVAVLVDAASYLSSAVYVTAIRHREPAPVPAPRHLRHEIGAGFRLVFGDGVLRAMALYGTASSTFIVFLNAIEVVFLVRTVGVPAYAIGILFSVSSLGSVLGAFLGTPLSRRLGDIRTLLVAPVIGDAFVLLVPLTQHGIRIALFAIGTAMASCGIVAYNVVAGAVSQLRCPDSLRGRMGATMVFVSWGALPVGALAAGAVADQVGVRNALWIGAAGLALSPLLLVFSPIRTGATTVPLPLDDGDSSIESPLRSSGDPSFTVSTEPLMTDGAEDTDRDTRQTGRKRSRGH